MFKVLWCVYCMYACTCLHSNAIICTYIHMCVCAYMHVYMCMCVLENSIHVYVCIMYVIHIHKYIQSTPDIKNHEIQKNLFIITGEVYVNVLQNVNTTSL